MFKLFIDYLREISGLFCPNKKIGLYLAFLVVALAVLVSNGFLEIKKRRRYYQQQEEDNSL